MNKEEIRVVIKKILRRHKARLVRCRAGICSGCALGFYSSCPRFVENIPVCTAIAGYDHDCIIKTENDAQELINELTDLRNLAGAHV